MPTDFLPEDDPIPQLPASFGSFLLLDQIARGGMGDVFLAKTGGTMGIEKHCVIKTLRARYQADAEYVGRFVDEARLVVQLSHRNICQVFDVGRVGNSYYLAMELVLGHDIRTLDTRITERGDSLPQAVALHVAIEMLEALDYAHRHVDPATGQPLHIVHRDVSPQNVLINYEGEVKLIDFGLAERGRALTSATLASGATNVMGKLAYMAPEQARGEIVDARADQFAAAVVVYELLAGERYYGGLNPRGVWQIVGGGTWEPPKLKSLDPALQAILRRALSADKADRYPSCGDFRDDLQEFSRSRALPSGQRALRELMGSLFADELGALRELLQRAARLAVHPGAASEGPATEFTSFASAPTSVVLHDPTEAIPRTASMPHPLHAGRARRVAALAGALAAAAAMLGVVLWATADDAAVPTAASATTTNASTTNATSTNATTTNATTTNATTTNATTMPPPEASAAATASTAPTTTEPPAAMPAAPPPPPVPAPGRPSRPPPRREPTLGDKMARLKKCSAPCAAPLVPWAGRLGEHPDLAGFTASLNACYRTCGGR
jgi:serine/threonine protein kinase